ncbi:hypothetical protein H312_00921 [Anncaliia algerae PRA339]|uniref:ISXO2-like transposase domain-containing protein n=1 Tax=Anncaliia algerae PRA339 TaxID=1288291 RepID=A0A059F3E2_9MICR|nr:hypothetical protein H312_00921 [Anncaliia algerae PRA339]
MDEAIFELYEMCFHKMLQNEKQLENIFKIDSVTDERCAKCNKSVKIFIKNVFQRKIKCSFCDTRKTINSIKPNFCKQDFIELIYLIYYFSLDCNFSLIKKLTRCTDYVLNKFQGAILQEIDKEHNRHFDKIGGENLIVEVDESFVGKRKYNIGRINNQKIILGGICRNSKRFFMKIISSRNKKTIGEAIESHINPGTTIFTDQWSSYLYFFKENTHYTHNFVNHKLYFVDPIDKTHTQNIESLWSRFKKFKRRKQYLKQKKLHLYIAEFSLRKKYEGDDLGLFSFLIRLVFN